MTADASGNLLTSLKYSAFGELRPGSSSTTDYQYTLQKHPGQAGQRNEIEIGLYYYYARYYDPQLGRFISADTIIPEAGKSQGYDRYAYTNNNPINFNDPSGHRACNGIDANGNCEVEYEWHKPGANNPKPQNTISTTVAVIESSITDGQDTPISNSRIESPELNMNFDIGVYSGELYHQIGIGSDYPENPITITYPPQVEFGSYSFGSTGPGLEWQPPFHGNDEQQLINSLNLNGIQDLFRTNPVIDISIQERLRLGNNAQIFQEIGLKIEIRTDRILSAVVIIGSYEAIPYILPIVNGNFWNLRGIPAQ